MVDPQEYPLNDSGTEYRGVNLQYLDGRRLGDTPLFRQPVSAGRHRVRAVRADGAARTFTITIAPAKELSYGQIAW